MLDGLALLRLGSGQRLAGHSFKCRPELGICKDPLRLAVRHLAAQQFPHLRLRTHLPHWQLARFCCLRLHACLLRWQFAYFRHLRRLRWIVGFLRVFLNGLRLRQFPHVGLYIPRRSAREPCGFSDNRLSSAEDATDGHTESEFLRARHGVEHGVLVLRRKHLVPLVVGQVLQRALQHALHDFFLTFFRGRLDPRFQRALTHLQLARQLLNTAGHFGRRVHKSIGHCKRICFPVRCAVRFCVLVVLPGHLRERQPEVWIFRHRPRHLLRSDCRSFRVSDDSRQCRGSPCSACCKLRFRTPAHCHHRHDCLRQCCYSRRADLVCDLLPLRAVLHVLAVVFLRGVRDLLLRLCQVRKGVVLPAQFFQRVSRQPAKRLRKAVCRLRHALPQHALPGFLVIRLCRRFFLRRPALDVRAVPFAGHLFPEVGHTLFGVVHGVDCLVEDRARQVSNGVEVFLRGLRAELQVLAE